ncbi:MAG: hypothetical protein ABIK68_23065 [bacterium]
MNSPLSKKGGAARELPGLEMPARIGVIALNPTTSILAVFLAPLEGRS